MFVTAFKSNIETYLVDFKSSEEYFHAICPIILPRCRTKGLDPGSCIPTGRPHGVSSDANWVRTTPDI
jgi:hypothetical protein